MSWAVYECKIDSMGWNVTLNVSVEGGWKETTVGSSLFNKLYKFRLFYFYCFIVRFNQLLMRTSAQIRWKSYTQAFLVFSEKWNSWSSSGWLCLKSSAFPCFPMLNPVYLVASHLCALRTFCLRRGSSWVVSQRCLVLFFRGYCAVMPLRQLIPCERCPRGTKDTSLGLCLW